MRRRRRRPLPSGRTAPAFLLLASATVVPSTAAGSGFDAASAENASWAREVPVASSGANSCSSGGAEGRAARRDCRRRGSSAPDDGDPLFFCGAIRGREGARKTGGGSRSSGAAFRVRGRVPKAAHALVVRGPSRAATTGGALLAGQATAASSSSRAGAGLRGMGSKRDLATHGGWGTRIGVLEKRIIEGVTPSRCAGRNARPNKKSAPGSSPQPRSVPGANADPAGLRSGEEVRRRSTGNPSEHSSVEQSAPAGVAYSALCPALDGDGSLSFASSTPPSTPVSITPKMLPSSSLPISSVGEIPRSLVENTAPEVSIDEAQRCERGSSIGGSGNEENTEAAELRGVSTVPQPGTTGGAFGSERNDLGTFGVGVDVSVEAGANETVRTVTARSTTLSSSEADSVAVMGRVAAASVSEAPYLDRSGGDAKGGMTSSIEDVTGRNGRRSRRKARGGRVGDGSTDSSLRGMLIDAVKTGRGGAALRALRLMGSWTSGLEVFRLLLENVRSRGRSPSQGAWKSLARGLRSVGQADQALVVLRQALRGGIEGIDEQVCSILLDLCAIKGRMGLAEEISSLMDTHGIPKGPVTFCVLLKGYGRQRRLSEVERVMREMRSRRVIPDVVALNAAVDAFVRCGELSKAKRVLRAMEDSPGGSIAQTLTYNTIIKGVGKELLLDEAFEFARSMVDRGCSPNEVTTNSLVDICVRSGDVDRAYDLLKNPTLLTAPASLGKPSGDASAAPSAVAAWVDPEDSGTRGSLEVGTADDLGEAVRGIAAVVVEDDVGQEDDVDGLLSMLSGGVGGGEGSTGSAPMDRNSSTLKTEAPAAGAVKADAGKKGGEKRLPFGLIDPAEAAAVATAAAAAAVEIEAGVEEGVTRISSSSIDAVAGKEGLAAEKSGGVGEGASGVRDREKSVRPSVEAFTSVLTGFAAVGDKDRALAVFQQMVNAGVKPNVVTFTALISACVNSADMDGAKRLFAALEARAGTVSDMQPSVFTYNTIIRGLCRMEDGSDDRGPQDEDSNPDEAAPDDDDPVLSLRQGSVARQPSEKGVSLPDVPGAPQGVKGFDSVEEVEDKKDEGGVNREKGVAVIYPGETKDEALVVTSPPGLLDNAAGEDESGTREGGKRGALPQGIREALQVLLSMRRRGVPADEITMNSLLDGLVSCSPPRMQEAEAVMNLMSGWGIKPNQVSYTVMLKGFGRVGDLGGAELMYELMANDRDQRPDVVALNSLLGACVRNSDFRRAVEILEQAINTALTGRATYTSREQWALSSSTRRPWGVNASAGAQAILKAALRPGEIGETDISGGAGKRSAEGGAPGFRGRMERRSRGIAIDVRPNQVSFATVVLGLSRRGNANAGRKAIALYNRMRRGFGFIPDEGMVDGLMAACWNAQAGQTGENKTALAEGKEALEELRKMGWDEQLIAAKEQMLMRVVPTLSEVWKKDGEEDRKGSSSNSLGSTDQRGRRSSSRAGGRGKGAAGTNRKRKVSAEIFEKYGWNKMESHFPVL